MKPDETQNYVRPWNLHTFSKPSHGKQISPLEAHELFPVAYSAYEQLRVSDDSNHARPIAVSSKTRQRSEPSSRLKDVAELQETLLGSLPDPGSLLSGLPGSSAISQTVGVAPSLAGFTPAAETSEPMKSAATADAAVSQSASPEPTMGEALSAKAVSMWESVGSYIPSLSRLPKGMSSDWFSKDVKLTPPDDEAIKDTLVTAYGGKHSLVRLSVTVEEATDVPPMDWTGYCDPYVQVCIVRGVSGITSGDISVLPTLGPQKYSSTKYLSLNPVWRETLELDPVDIVALLSDSTVHVSLWDKDVIKEDDAIGFFATSILDPLQVSGVSPYPLCPVPGGLPSAGPHAGVFLRIDTKLVDRVSFVTVTPIALQGFTTGLTSWQGYKASIIVRIAPDDPLCVPKAALPENTIGKPEISRSALLTATGHALWASDTPPVSILCKAPPKTKPYIHVIVQVDMGSVIPTMAQIGQVSVRAGLVEKLKGVAPFKLTKLQGYEGEDDALKKCSVYISMTATIDKRAPT